MSYNVCRPNVMGNLRVSLKLFVVGHDATRVHLRGMRKHHVCLNDSRWIALVGPLEPKCPFIICRRYI